MNDTCETVRIVSKEAPDGYIVINKEDMKEGMKVWKESKPKQVKDSE